MVGALGGMDFQAGEATGLGKGRVNTKLDTNTKAQLNDMFKMASSLFSEVDPVRKLLSSQFQEALSTGGVGAQIPIINRAVENSRLATSNTLRQLDDQLGRFNLSGTPYGQAIRANTLLGGELSTANIPTDFTKAFLSMAPNFAVGAGSQISGLAEPAVRLPTQVDITQGTNLTNQRLGEMQAFTQLASSFMGMVGKAAGSMGGGGAAA